uniref:Uncharacterized protein n=1 Tax=Oryza nivara TaxID=4536 RepID=A0A0E0HC20_ORYNI
MPLAAVTWLSSHSAYRVFCCPTWPRHRPSLLMWIKSSCSLTTQVWLPLGQSPPISISKPPTDRCGIKRPYGRIPVINNWLREGQRRMRRSTARCNKLTRNRRQGLCVVRAARRATQFARVGWCCELQGASCGRMDPQDYES